MNIMSNQFNHKNENVMPNTIRSHAKLAAFIGFNIAVLLNISFALSCYQQSYTTEGCPSQRLGFFLLGQKFPIDNVAGPPRALGNLILFLVIAVSLSTIGALIGAIVGASENVRARQAQLANRPVAAQ